jgi:hypothetical protein
MAQWNPSAPTLIGNEYLPTRVPTQAITSLATTVPGQQIPSTVAESVSALAISLGGVQGVGQIVADVYAAGTVPTAPGRASRLYYPTADVSRTGWTSFAGATTNLYTHVDENPDAANFGDGIREPSGSTNAAVQFQAGSGAFPASRRVLAVNIILQAIGGDIAVGFVNGGTAYEQRTGYNGVTGSNGFRRRVLSWGELCPWTGLPWTRADIVGLSTGATTVRVRRADNSGGFLIPQVAALAVHVIDYPEDRVAFGIGTIIPGDNQDLDLTTYTPTAGGAATAGWAKAAGTTYTVVVRAARSSSTLIATGIRQTWGTGPNITRLPAGVPAAVAVTLNSDGSPSTSSARSVSRALGLGLLVGSATSVDSQPWVRIMEPDLRTGTNRQQFTPSVSGNYGVVRALVKVPPGGSLGRLRIRIRRASDNTIMGGEVQITREEALAGTDMGDGWFLAQAQLGTPAALVGGTAYRIEFTVVGPDRWTVALLGARPGLTDQFEPANSSAFWFSDSSYLAQVSLLPAPLGGAVDVASLDVPVTAPHAPDLTPCASDGLGVPVAVVSWPSTTLGADFLAYEVERSDDRDPEWRTVARYTSPTVTEFYDHEVRLGGVSTRFRVRQVRTDGIGSDWVTSAETAFSSPAGCAGGMVWSSNLAPVRTVLAPDLSSDRPRRSYSFLEADDLTLQAIYGRDGMVAFRSLERRGVTFDREITVDALIGSTGRPRGETVFDTLRALVSARDLPYVCVRDDYGDRWLASTNVTDAVAGPPPGDHHVANVTVTELTEEPAVVTAWNGVVGAPWVARSGTWGIDRAAGSLRLVEAESTGPNIVAMPTPFADRGAATARFVPGASGDPRHAKIGLAVKVVDDQNYIAVVSNPAFSAMEFVKVVGGTRSPLVTNWLGGGNDGVEIRWIGRSSTPGGLLVVVLENGTVRGTAAIADPVFDGAGDCGLIVESATAGAVTRFEDFEAFDPLESPGGSWTTPAGVWRAEGSLLRCLANDITTPGRNFALLDAGTGDAQIRYRVHTAANDIVLIARWQDAENYLYVQCFADFGGWTIGKRVAGVNTTIQNVPLVPVVGSVVLQVWGNRLRFRTPGSWQTTVEIPADAAFLAGQTRHGISAAGNRSAGRYAGRVDLVQIDRAVHLGVSGSALSRSGVRSGGAVDIVRDLPTAPLGLGAGDLFVGVWGINDAINGTGQPQARAWTEANRSILSRVFRETNVVDTDPSITYSPTWVTVADTTQSSGAGWRRSTNVGDALSFPVAVGSNRGPLALSFAGSNSVVGVGGTADIKVDGVTVATVDTRLWGTGDAQVTPVTARVVVPAGNRTIRVEVTSGRIAFDGWGWERHPADPANPAVVLANTAVLSLSPDIVVDRWGPSMAGNSGADWPVNAWVGREVTIYKGTGAGQSRIVTANSTTDVSTDTPWTTVPDQTSWIIVKHPSFWGWITRDTVAFYNAALEAVVNEFGRHRVGVADMNRTLDENPALFEGTIGGLHPDEDGHRLVGRAIAEAIPGGIRRVSRLVVAGHSYSVASGTAQGSGLDDVARRMILSPIAADGFDRPEAPRYRDNFDR